MKLPYLAGLQLPLHLCYLTGQSSLHFPCSCCLCLYPSQSSLGPFSLSQERHQQLLWGVPERQSKLSWLYHVYFSLLILGLVVVRDILHQCLQVKALWGRLSGKSSYSTIMGLEFRSPWLCKTGCGNIFMYNSRAAMMRWERDRRSPGSWGAR